MRAFTETSSAETLSSATISRGSSASARAMQMRWRWPPENSCGWRRMCSGESPTRRKKLGDPVAPLRGLGDAVDRQRLGDEVAHGHPGVERGVGVLEDHLHVAQHRAHRRRREGRGSAVPSPGCRLPTGARLSSARPVVDLPQPELADERERLARADGEADAVDRVDAGDAARRSRPPRTS